MVQPQAQQADRAGLQHRPPGQPFMAWNLLHLAKMLDDAGGIPAYGNQPSAWDDGNRFDWENPEYRRA